MKIGILGTGMVGQTLGDKLIQLGHEVVMGSRDSANEKAAEWVSRNGERASHGVFSEAASFGEMVLPLWINLYMNFQSANFNFKIVRQT
jgi:predicted dinucleotide-binding enzyme